MLQKNKIFTLFVVLILLLAACGGGQEEEADTGDGSETAVESDSADSEESDAEEAAADPAEFAGTIRIGAAVSESGKYAREGKDVRQGYELWADWVNNEHGGIDVGGERYEVEIVYYDDESDPDTGANLTEKLITEDEVDFLLGPYSSSMTAASSAIAEKYGIVMVEGNGSSESLFERGFENLFAVLTPAGNYTQSALESLAAQGAETVVIAYEDTAFPTSVAEGAQRWAEEYGLEILAVETYPKDVADVSAIITKFRDLEPDVFVGGGHFNDALLFVNASKELGFEPQAMVITVGPSNPQFVEEVGEDAEYIIGPTQWERTMSWSGPYIGTSAEYGDRYEAMWGEPPTYQAAESTAAALALLAAIEDAATLDMDAIRQSLNDLDIVTFYGPINFDDTGKNVAKPMGAVQIQGGAINVVAPSAAAVADLLYPMGAAMPEPESAAPVEFAGTIRIGAAISESGKYAREGKDVRQGYELWADWVNSEHGGIDVGGERYEVEIVYYDDESDPDTGANLTEKLITEDEVDFLLGPYSSSMTAAASAIAEKYGVVMVEGNGSSESLFERGFQNLFAVLTPAGNYTQSALEALAAQGAESVVIAYEDTAFPTSVAEGAQRWAEEYGLDILAVETYPKDVADVSAIMTKFRDLDPDVFVGGGHFNDALLFVNAAKELGFSPQAMVITVGPSNPQFVEEVGGDANLIIGPTQWERTMSWNGPYIGTSAEYGDRYETMWGEAPTYQAAESTAAALALMAAIEDAASLDMDAIRQSLNDLDIVTFYGPINFDETGKNTAKPMGAVQIQDGEINVVAPADAAVADLEYPLIPWDER